MKKGTPTKTFGVLSCRDLLDKLERELDRLKLACDRDDIVDHALNFCFTCWSMTEWVWKAIKSDPAKLNAVANHLSVGPGVLTKRPYYVAVLKHQFIRYCRDIATETKHFQVTQSGFTTAVSTQYPDLDRIMNFEIGNGKWVLKIVEGDDRHGVVSTFEFAHAFWTSLLFSCNVE